MPLPHPRVVSAFFDSYVTIRKDLWGLDINYNGTGEVRMPEDEVAREKIKTTTELLVKFQIATKIEDWLKLLNDLYQTECSEQKQYDAKYAVSKLFASDQLLKYTVRAARTYIISVIESEPEYKTLKQTISDQAALLEWQLKNNKAQLNDENKKKLNEINFDLAATCGADEKDKHNYISFFQDEVLKLDARKLDEKSFDDFKNHVLQNARTLVMCVKLLEHHKKNAPKDKQTVQKTISSQPSVTAPTVSTTTVTAAPTASVVPVPTYFQVASTSDSQTEKPKSKDKSTKEEGSPLANHSVFPPKSSRRPKGYEQLVAAETNDEEKPSDRVLRKRTPRS